jgi:hypothetical protein
MSTAILISGQMRTFAQCYPTQRWHVLRHFPDPHFFITVQDTPDCQSIDLLTAEWGKDRVHPDVRTDPVLEVTQQIHDAYNFAPYANAAPAGQLLMQHWYQNECWKHFKSLSAKLSGPAPGEDPRFAPLHAFCDDKFDTIIRIRPDQFFHSFEDPLRETTLRFSEGQPNGSVSMQREINGGEAFTPWWGRFGGVNDRLAILGRRAAKAYFTVYDRIPELLAEYHCPFHPESLVKAALETAGCTIHETLRTEFTTLRQDGNHRAPEIMPWDLAHAAMRAA